MKKKIVSALTMTLVAGAFNTSFAAANPFSDVPSDHWAYDAVTKLADDGVIEGYGDSTFKGEHNITRYEMAQMVAKAMAKAPTGSDKELVDKLAAEFAEELSNLGVRVSNLERNADRVKWNGKAEYTYRREKTDYYGFKDWNVKDHNLLLRLEPSAEVNDIWHVKARLDANTDMKFDTGNSGDVELKRIWAQGDYKNFQVKLGKFGNDIADDLVYDNPFSGAEVTFGKNVQFSLAAGRASREEFDTALKTWNGDGSVKEETNTANYQGIGLKVDTGSKLTGRAAYQRFDWHLKDTDQDVLGIWSVGGNYRFDKNIDFDAVYAKSNRSYDFGRDKQNKSYALELRYKGAEAANKGTWGAWVAYRKLGALASVKPTYDAIGIGADVNLHSGSAVVVDHAATGYKGWEAGFNYVPLKNVVTTVRYGHNKGLYNDGLTKQKVLFGRVELFF